MDHKYRNTRVFTFRDFYTTVIGRQLCRGGWLGMAAGHDSRARDHAVTLARFAIFSKFETTHCFLTAVLSDIPPSSGVRGRSRFNRSVLRRMILVSWRRLLPSFLIFQFSPFSSTSFLDRDAARCRGRNRIYVTHRVGARALLLRNCQELRSSPEMDQRGRGSRAAFLARWR